MAETLEQSQAKEAWLKKQYETIDQEKVTEETQEETPQEEVVETTEQEEQVQEEVEEEVEEAEEEVVEEVHEEGQETNEPSEPVQKKKGVDKTPPEQRQFWKTKRLQEENARIKEELAYIKGKIENIAPPITETPTYRPIATPPLPQISPNAQAQLDALDKAYDEGSFQGSYEDKLAVRAAIISQDYYAPRQAQAQKATEAKQKLDRILKEKSKVLPGVEKAFEKLAKDPVTGNDPVIGIAIREHLEDGGIDVAYYLSNHPEYTSRLLELPTDDRMAKLVELRKTLTKPKSVVKKTIKPSTPIRNSITNVKSSQDVDDSDYAAEMAKIRKARANH